MNNNIDYFNEANANKFEKFINKKTIQQNEKKANLMKSKYFPLEMAKMMKGKNIENIKIIQKARNMIVNNPDIYHWTSEDVINFLKEVDLEKYIENIEKNGIDGKKLLNLDNKGISNIFNISDKNEISNINKLLEFLKGVKLEKFEKVNEEIENVNSEEDDKDKNQLTKKFRLSSIKEKLNSMPNDKNNVENEKNEIIPNKENILKELTRQSKYFYSTVKIYFNN